MKLTFSQHLFPQLLYVGAMSFEVELRCWKLLWNCMLRFTTYKTLVTLSQNQYQIFVVLLPRPGQSYDIGILQCFFRTYSALRIYFQHPRPHR